MSTKDTYLSKKGILSSLLRVQMTLRDVIYISYALPTGRLLPLVPDELRLATADGKFAFVSLVILNSTRVRLTSFPLIRFNYNQFNIRTYVIDPVSGQPAVYFIRSGVTSRIISLVTNISGIPWEFIELAIESTTTKRLHCISISGNWQERFALKLQASTKISVIPPFFDNRKSAVDFLIRPLIGFSGDNLRLGRFTILHPEVQPENWSLLELDCPLFRKLVMIDDLKKPHSIFYLPTADFSIFLPPTRGKKRGE
ncbi:DUF2071 domain-containing protein [Chloroflexota bacterium]